MGTKGPVGEWLEQKYLEWMQAEGGFRKQYEFAEYLGIDKVLLNQYINGRRRPEPEFARTIADKLGPEVYILLDMPNPDPRIKRINQAMNEMEDEELLELLKYIDELREKKRIRVGNEIASGSRS